MKPPPFDYHRPESLEEALRLRAELGPDASVLAGGQSLVPMLNMRLARPAALIDLNRVPGLAGIRVEGGAVRVGAMTRHRALERSDEAHAACPLLREALGLVAHAIVRNRGTIGGSIAHADPAAELPSVLTVLGGHVVATSVRGQRTVAASDLFEFHFTTSLEPDELVTEVVFPLPPSGAGTAFLEISRRHGDYALAGVACVVANGSTRLCFTGVGPTPVLVESDDPEAAAAATQPADDIHGTARYRRALVRVLARRATALARERAGGGAA
ncbi:MAG: xanthine dehydrogenase family protein subunit M [Thermoleophilia bacterium]